MISGTDLTYLLFASKPTFEPDHISHLSSLFADCALLYFTFRSSTEEVRHGHKVTISRAQCCYSTEKDNYNACGGIQ